MVHNPATMRHDHRLIRAYREAMAGYAGLQVTHETGVRVAFLRLVEDAAKAHGWNLVQEAGQKVEGRTIRPDATLYKSGMPRGYCESKDTHDDLDTEIRKKRDKGYPLSNIIFEDSRGGVLYQNRQEAFRADLGNDQQIAQLLNQFFMYSAGALYKYGQAHPAFFL